MRVALLTLEALASAAPVRTLLESMEAETRRLALAEMTAALSVFERDGRFEAGSELLLASGTA